MKRITLIALALLSAFAQAENIKISKPKPNKALVYLSGAELSYRNNLYLNSGVHDIVIDGVSPILDENSISAYLKGGTVIDARKEVYYTETKTPIAQHQKYYYFIQKINDSIEDVEWEIKDCSNKLIALGKEKQLLLGNKMIRGEFTKDSLALLKASLDLLKVRLRAIDDESLVQEKRNGRLEKLLNLLNARLTYYTNLQNSNLNTIDPQSTQPIHQIIVSVDVQEAGNCQLVLKYYVYSAGWTPLIDIMASASKSSLKLIQRAKVYQNSGIDWKDVDLVLSTSNPSQGNERPYLSIWNLYYGYPNSYPAKVNKAMSRSTYNEVMKPEVSKKSLTTQDDAEGASFDANQIEPIFTIDESVMRIEYSIKTSSSIASDNKPHHVVINSTEVPYTMAYSAVPKLDPDAFLMGKLVGWEDLNLLPSSARLYFDESFIGTTTIDPQTTSDTLLINLGRDKEVVMKRFTLKEKCKDQILSDLKSHTKSYEITIRNTKAIALDFDLEDQMPVSNDPTIKINLIDKDGATLNELTGQLSWHYKLKPKETKKVRFTYEVKYPKDKFIQGL
ncbi:MAG: hypothetical protein RLZZ318_1735 [Bacteroidota bacterium]